jgi:hypothetical protein
VEAGVRRLGGLRLREQPGVGLLDHLLAEVHEHQVVLEDRVVEDVLSGLAEVDDPLAERRGLDPVGHVLRVHGADRVVVAADAADAARDEVGVAWILALHEHAVAAEQGGRALARGDLLVAEVDLRVDAEVADDPGDRIPRHLDEIAGLGLDALADGHQVSLSRPGVSSASAAGSRW